MGLSNYHHQQFANIHYLVANCLHSRSCFTLQNWKNRSPSDSRWVLNYHNSICILRPRFFRHAYSDVIFNILLLEQIAKFEELLIVFKTISHKHVNEPWDLSWSFGIRKEFFTEETNFICYNNLSCYIGFFDCVLIGISTGQDCTGIGFFACPREIHIRLSFILIYS